MANLMELVRELKSLNARKKAGEALAPDEEQRRKELKGFLRSTLESQGGAGSLEDSGVKEAPSRSSSAPKDVPKPRPPAAPPPDDLPPPAAAVAPPPYRPPNRTAPAPAPAPSGNFMEDMLPTMAPSQRPAPVSQAPAAAPKPFVPKKDIYAIADAGSLIDDAMGSEAVAKVDPFTGRKARASSAEVEEAEARADAAIRATKKKERAKNADEAVQQLQESSGGYTPPDNDFVNEQYYGSFESEGYAFVSAADAGDLKPIDPREIELSKLDVAGTPGSVTTNAAVPAGLAFLDDFPALYARRVLPAPDDEVVIDSSDPDLLIPGKRKVTVHLLNGEKRQGSIRALRRGELGFKLEPLGSGTTEELSITQVKAVFIHTQANSTPRDVPGRALTATFRDGRAVQGVSDDYQPGAPVFTLVPPSGRGQFERIIVNAAAVQSVV